MPTWLTMHRGAPSLLGSTSMKCMPLKWYRALTRERIAWLKAKLLYSFMARLATWLKCDRSAVRLVSARAGRTRLLLLVPTIGMDVVWEVISVVFLPGRWTVIMLMQPDMAPNALVTDLFPAMEVSRVLVNLTIPLLRCSTVALKSRCAWAEGLQNSAVSICLL